MKHNKTKISVVSTTLLSLCMAIGCSESMNKMPHEEHLQKKRSCESAGMYKDDHDMSMKEGGKAMKMSCAKSECTSCCGHYAMKSVKEGEKIAAKSGDVKKGSCPYSKNEKMG
jgi:hypothetical protein